MLTIAHKDIRHAVLLAAVCCMTIFICAAPIAAQAEGAEGGQGAARVLKKKIALAQFDVANTQHVDDISNIYDGLPLTLSGRLEASGKFLTVYTGRSIPVEAGEAQREAIIQIAEEAGAQFLISGRVVNAGTRHEKGFLGTSLGEKTVRQIEVELAVYDGFSGARLLLRRLDEQAQGNMKVGNDKPFGSSLFFGTELGKALNRLLDVAVADIHAALEKVPFSARIIRVEGKKAFLDAGGDALLKTGDQFVAYVRDATPFAGPGLLLGVTERAADAVTLIQVQPQFSVGELSEDLAKQGIKVGDIARIAPDELRALLAKQIAAQQKVEAEQEAKAEAERLKVEQAAQAEAARIRAKQEAKAEAARIKAEKKVQAQAAAAAKLKAAQATKTARISAAQQAKARAQAQAARLKAKQKTKTEVECVDTGEKTPAKTETKAATASAVPQTAESGVAEAKASAGTAEEKELINVKKKPVVPLKLKPIKP